jgi:ABC-type amino acid transport substrate-binding protein
MFVLAFAGIPKVGRTHEGVRMSSGRGGSSWARAARDATGRWPGALGSALVVGALALAGCGSSSDGSGSKSASTGGEPAKARSVAVCLDGASPPQESYTASNQPEGSEIDMLSSIASKANLQLKYQKLQFNGLIPALLSKQCDLVSAGLFVKPERTKVVNFVLNSINGQSLMVQKGKDEGITGYNNTLAGKDIGMPSGYATIPVVQKECAKIAKETGKAACKVVQFGNVPDTYNSLKTGKVDVVIDATSSIGYFAANNASAFQLVDAPPVLPSQVGFAVRKDDAALQGSVQKAMDELYSSGEACEILSKWKIPATALPPAKC